MRATVRLLACLVPGLLLIAVPAAQARPAEPRIDVPRATLRASLFCQESVTRATRTPVLLITGTGVDGSEAWPDGLQKGLVGAGVPSCYVNFPRHTTDDVQLAAQYVVAAIRAVARRAERDIAVFGVSQGALLPRFALTYWPSLRRQVTDVVAVAGTQRGTTTFSSMTAACGTSCRFPAAAWQQAAGSQLVRALNRYPDETPGPTAWTTVRSTTDEVVQPTGGPAPASALTGATNLVIQRVCPGRVTNHITTGVDSVSYAVLIDAITHRGPAQTRRLPAGVCRRPFAPQLDPARIRPAIAELYNRALPRTLQGADGGKLLPREPALQAYVRATR
jgi:triacylglycerol lipase